MQGRSARTVPITAYPGGPHGGSSGQRGLAALVVNKRTGRS